MPERMLCYWLDIHTSHPDWPIHQYVVYIGKDKLRMANHIRKSCLHYEYRLLDIREVDLPRFPEAR